MAPDWTDPALLLGLLVLALLAANAWRVAQRWNARDLEGGWMWLWMVLLLTGVIHVVVALLDYPEAVGRLVLLSGLLAALLGPLVRLVRPFPIK